MPRNTTKLPTPCVHTNGSGEKALTEQSRDVYRAIGLTMDAMRAARPHGRDYYPLEDRDALTKAQAAHAKLYKMIHDISDEYIRLADNIRRVAKGEEALA